MVKIKWIVKIKCLSNHRHKAMVFVEGEVYEVDEALAKLLIGDFPNKFEEVNLEVEAGE